MSTQITSIPCAACQRLNLPGGVRCAYCGTPYPPVLDFDLGLSAPSPTPATATTAATPASPSAAQQGRRAGIVSTLGLLLLKGKSLLTLFKFGKIATTLGSMLVFIWADAMLFGWKFGVGLAVCILIHELGHVFVNWRKGIPQTAPMFIPFVGAVIFVKSFPNNPTVESESGAGGPFAGMLAALVCLLIARMTGSAYWLALANIGFIINLFNLIPFPPLDGSHIGSVFSPRIWSVVLITLLLWVIKMPSAMLWMVLVVGFLFRLGSGDGGRHLLAPPRVRVRMAVLYVLLSIGLGTAAQYTTVARPTRSSGRATSSVAFPTAARVSNARPAPPMASSSSATTAPAARHRVISKEAALVITSVFAALVLLVLTALWLLIPYLLCAASDTSLRWRKLTLTGLMLALLALLGLGGRLLPFLRHNPGQNWAAYVAATGAALVFAGYQAVHLARKRVRPAYMELLAGCLGWACGGALLIAYTYSNWSLAGYVAVLALAFYLRYPAMLFGLLAEWASGLGEYPHALRLLQQAVALKPASDAETQAKLWTRLTHLYLLQDRGGAALQALDAKEAIARASLDGTQPYAPGLNDLDYRASALMLQDRFEEALVCCEQMLRVSEDDKLGALRLLSVHIRLSRIAHYRGWEDEAIAQSDWCLRFAAKLSKPLVARLHVGRAAALAALERADEARQACKQALEAASDPYTQAWTASIQAQICLQEGNAAEAEQAAIRAARLMPDNIQYRYWHGVALLAGGHTQEGRELVKDVAVRHAEEHWGRRAQAALT